MIDFTTIESETHIITHQKALAELKRENGMRRSVYERSSQQNPVLTETFCKQYRASIALQQLLEEMTPLEYERFMLRRQTKLEASMRQATLF